MILCPVSPDPHCFQVHLDQLFALLLEPVMDGILETLSGKVENRAECSEHDHIFSERITDFVLGESPERSLEDDGIEVVVERELVGFQRIVFSIKNNGITFQDQFGFEEFEILPTEAD